MGVTQFSDNWMPISTPHSHAPIFCQFDFTGFFTPRMFMVVFSLLLVNIFDTIGTVLGLVSKLGIKENEKGEIPGVKEAMMSDAIGTTAGVLMIDSFKKIELEDISESFPAFITMITMVLCYSIADGICLGILSYVLIKMMVGKFKDLNLTLYILSIFLLINYAFG